MSRETSDIDSGTVATNLSGGFLQGLWSPRSDLDVSMTGRFDRNSDFGTFTTGRIAVAWAATDFLSLRGAASTGFRAPSNFERFARGFGNPTLQPERSRSVEVGADLRLATDAVVSATLFDLRIRDAIGFPVDRYEQVPGTSRRRGVELEGGLPLGERVAISANYTFTDATDSDGLRLARVPRHDLGLSVETLLGDRLSNVTTLQALGDRFDGNAETNRMPGFAVINTRFAFALTQSTELSLRVDNILDRQYQLVRGYGTSDRAFYVGLASRF